jgi:hypothetical protein
MNDRTVVTEFKKASASQGGQQECVEVAATASGGTAVRDTKNRSHGTQYHSPAAWTAFLTTLKAEATP